MRGGQVVIDGAHTLGMFDNPDFSDFHYSDIVVFNCHKWLSGSRGTGLLWILNDEIRSNIRSFVISHGSKSGFQSDFMWQGNKDYANYLSLNTSLDCRRLFLLEEHCNEIF